MASINKVMLIGNLGKDPEIRYTNSGSAVANFSIATNESWKDKEGNRQERTEWHNIVAWGKLADFAQNYLKKGKSVYLEGRIQTRDWVDNQDVKHYKTEIVANNIQFVGPREEGDQGGRAPAAARGGSGGPQAPYPDQNQGGPQPDEGAYLEDDIPF